MPELEINYLLFTVYCFRVQRILIERYTPLVAEFGPEGKLWGINKSSEAAIGGGARSAPLIVAIRSN
jgi:hypothetical protein